MYAILFLLITITSAEIIKFHGHTLTVLSPEYWTIPKFAKHDVPNWYPGKGKSFIDLSRIRFSSSCSSSSSTAPCPTTKLDIIMFQEPTGKNWIEYWNNNQYCCTASLVAAGECQEENRLIFPSSLPMAVHSQLTVGSTPVSLTPDDTIYHHDIMKTGVYIIMMATCDENKPSVILNGELDSMDPYGYVPAEQFAYIPFYMTMSIAYLILALVWLIACLINSKELIILQYWISGVLAFGLFETCFEYGYYINWNESGIKHIIVAIISSICGVSKRALSRIVIQMVALGYGIVRPTLGDELYKVLLLGGIYFILSLIYTLSTKFSSSGASLSDPEYNFIALIILMLAGVDTIFYIWIITSINNLLITLAARKLVVKYLLYRNFRNVLYISLFFTSLWIIYGSVQTVNDGYGEDNNWTIKWTLDALWELTYFILFLIICIMWAPYKNSQRYAYSYETVQVEDDEEWQQVNNQLHNYSGNTGNSNEKDNEDGYDSDHVGSGPYEKPTLKKKKYILDDDSDEDINDNNTHNHNNYRNNRHQGDGSVDDALFMSSGALDSHMAILKKN